MTTDEAKAITERLVRTHGPLIRKLIDGGTAPLEALLVAAKVDMVILEEIREGKSELALAVRKDILDRTWAALMGARG